MKSILCRLGRHRWKGCRCQRRGCGATRGIGHDWREWVYGAQDSCAQQRRCRHCSAEEARTQHDWGEWNKSAVELWLEGSTSSSQLSIAQKKGMAYDTTRVCRHCGETEKTILQSKPSSEALAHSSHTG